MATGPSSTSGNYLTVYVAATALAVTPFIAFLILNGRAWLINYREKQDRRLRTQQGGRWAVAGGSVPAPRERYSVRHRRRQVTEQAGRAGRSRSG